MRAKNVRKHSFVCAGKEIAPGQIGDFDEKNPAVKGWLAEGWIEPVEEPTPASKGKGGDEKGSGK